MKTLFEISDEIIIDGCLEKIIIIDFEIFDNVVLYYTSDGKVYPEEKIIQSKFNTEIVKDYIVSNLQSKECVDYSINFFKDLNEGIKKPNKKENKPSKKWFNLF